MIPCKKFLSFTETESGCYEISSHKKRTNGYHIACHDGRQTGIHRIIWEECFGFIPNGMEVCHKCDNPSCINPEHLFLGTQADNNRDMWKKGRARGGSLRGEKSPHSKLSDAARREIRRSYPSCGSMAQIARHYGVSQTTVYDIISNRKHKPLPVGGAKS